MVGAHSLPSLSTLEYLFLILSLPTVLREKKLPSALGLSCSVLLLSSPSQEPHTRDLWALAVCWFQQINMLNSSSYLSPYLF